MELRKVQEMGGGTPIISLPKKWAKQNSIKKGDVLSLEVRKDNSLIIYPFMKEEKVTREATITYPKEYIEYLVNEITGAYLLGYDVIRVQGKERITYEDRDRLKKAIRQLIGLEIVEEDAQSVTIQSLLEPTTLTPEKIFRRMHMISGGMHRDAITSLLEKDEHLVKVVVERDEEVDRLHFLLIRLIRSAIVEPRLLDEFGLSAVDCIDYRVASNLLEAVGDSSVDIAKNVLKLSKFLLDDALKKGLEDARDVLEKMQELVVRAFLTKSVKDARQAIELSSRLMAQMGKYEKAILGRPLEVFTPLSSILSSINRVCHYHIDIADLAVPLYPIVR